MSDEWVRIRVVLGSLLTKSLTGVESPVSGFLNRRGSLSFIRWCLSALETPEKLTCTWILHFIQKGLDGKLGILLYALAKLFLEFDLCISE